MLRKRKKSGQTVLEYTVIIILMLGAFLAMQNYVKRGIQGRWKDSADELGEQYDPKTANSSILHTIVSNTETRITSVNSAGGFWTSRTDLANSVETKSGYLSVGAY